MNVKVKDHYIKIFDSYKISQLDFDACFDYIQSHYKTRVFDYRDRESMRREWATHNLSYMMGILPDHSRDVTFEMNISKPLKIIYNILGWFALKLIN